MTSPTDGYAHDPKLVGFVSLLNNAAALLSNPALGFKDSARIAAILGYGVTLITNAAATVEEMQEVNAQVQLLVDERRVPTEDEWGVWDDRLTSVDAQFDSVRHLLAEELPDETV